MADVDKVIRGQERCKECNNAPAFGMNQAYIDCEYTIGLYCGQDKLRNETIEVLKSQREEIERLKAEKAPATRHEWLDKEYGFGTCVATCSNCGRYVKGTAHDNGFGFDYFFYPFCPYCGVEMNEEDVDDGYEEDEEGDPDA